MSQRRVGKICNIQRASRSARFRAVFEHTRPARLHICPDQKFFPTSLCGVLVFGSVSRRPPVPPARPPARLPHTTCSHTTCPHTQLAHTQLVHTQLTHTQLAHTQLVLSSHNLSSHNLLTHTHLVLTQLTTCSRTTCPHTTCPHTTWQAWHLATSTFTLRGRRGTWRHPPSLCVAGVALTALGRLWWRTGSPRLFKWRAWHLVTSTVTLRGRRGTW